MLSLPRLTSLLLLLPLRLESTLNSLPSQLSHSQSQGLLPQQLSQPMLLLLHSIMDTMVVSTMATTHTMPPLTTMLATTHTLLMEHTHMPLPHTPMSSLLKNRPPVFSALSIH